MFLKKKIPEPLENLNVEGERTATDPVTKQEFNKRPGSNFNNDKNFQPPLEQESLSIETEDVGPLYPKMSNDSKEELDRGYESCKDGSLSLESASLEELVD